MDRKNFLKTLGATGVGMSLPFENAIKSFRQVTSPPQVCELIPSETAGPFPLDLTENTFFFRQDIREGQEGIELTLKMKVFGIDNCEPMPNARVNIWHCTSDGLYSGYNGNNNPGQAGLTYLRGYQITDANGEVEFTTIFPGWYNGRICHIHFQVYVSSAYSAVSQLTFPLDAKNQLYANHASLYPKGADPKSFSQDMVFRDGHEYQLATLEKDSATGKYSSYLEVGVRGSGLTGVGHIENQIAEVFELGQNYPNPYQGTTTIPFELKQAAEVRLDLWDLQGRRVATLLEGRKTSGRYDIAVNFEALGLESGHYVYQLEAKNDDGTFRLPKRMTAL